MCHRLFAIGLVLSCGMASAQSGGPTYSSAGVQETRTVVEWSFDAGTPLLQGWEVSSSDPMVIWNADPSPATLFAPYFSPPNSLNYNNGTHYDAMIAIPSGSIYHMPNSGTAVSPPVDVGKLKSPTLTFRCNYLTEDMGTTYDQRRVQISSESFVNTGLLRDWILGSIGTSGEIGNCGSLGSWHEHTVALDSAWGTIRIRFNFNTVDAISNGFPGWFVDDIRVTSLEPVLGSIESSSDDDPGSGGGCGASVTDRPRPGWELLAMAGVLGVIFLLRRRTPSLG